MSTPSSHFLRKRRRGAAMIEFGFWFPITITLLSALVDFSWYMGISQNVMQAARDGARTGSAEPDNTRTTNNEAEAAARSGAQAVIDAMGLTCNPPVAVEGVALGMDTITVTVTCPFDPLVGLVPVLPANIQYQFTMFKETPPSTAS